MAQVYKKSITADRVEKAKGIALEMTPQITIGSGLEGFNDLGDITFLKVVQLVNNKLATAFSYKSTASASNMTNANGIKTGYYRIPIRNNVKKSYDTETGYSKDRTKDEFVPIQITNTLGKSLMVEDYDMEGYLEGDAGVREALVSKWIGSVVESLIANKEAIFLAGVTDYHIARWGAGDKTSIVIADFSKANTMAEVQDLFYSIGEAIADKSLVINKYSLGIDENQLKIAMGVKAYLKGTKAFTNFIDRTGAEAITSGTWFQNQILGSSEIQKNFYLDRKIEVGQINDEVEYDMEGNQMAVLHNEAWANPESFQKVKAKLDNDTDNMLWIIKYLGSLPMAIRGETGFIVMKEEPTPERIALAVSRGALSNGNLSGSEFTNEFTFQVAPHDSLVYDFVKNGGVLPETTVTVAPKTATIQVGATTDLTITVTNPSGTTTAISGTPANATVGVISGNKVTVTGVAVGTSVITITNNGKTDTATITVEEVVKKTK